MVTVNRDSSWPSGGDEYALPGQRFDQLIADLKKFTPRCKRVNESIEDHMLYAGKVELAQTLLSKYGKD